MDRSMCSSWDRLWSCIRLNICRLLAVRLPSFSRYYVMINCVIKKTSINSIEPFVCMTNLQKFKDTKLYTFCLIFHFASRWRPRRRSRERLNFCIEVDYICKANQNICATWCDFIHISKTTFWEIHKKTTNWVGSSFLGNKSFTSFH